MSYTKELSVTKKKEVFRVEINIDAEDQVEVVRELSNLQNKLIRGPCGSYDWVRDLMEIIEQK